MIMVMTENDGKFGDFGKRPGNTVLRRFRLQIATSAISLRRFLALTVAREREVHELWFCAHQRDQPCARSASSTTLTRRHTSLTCRQTPPALTALSPD
jgi:hypothetical protein